MVEEVRKRDERVKQLEKELEVQGMTSKGSIGELFAREMLMSVLTSDSKPPLPKVQRGTQQTTQS